MKKGIIFILAAVLFYSFFRDMTVMKVFWIIAGLGATYGISRVPAKTFTAMKYPLIVISLLLTVLSVVYPQIIRSYHLEVLCIFAGFYALALLLFSLENHGKAIAKEVISISVLYGALAVNLYVFNRIHLMIPLSLGVILYLYMCDKVKIIPFIGGYLATVVLVMVLKGVPFFGGRPALTDIERYLVLGMMFLFLALAYISLVKSGNPLKTFVFFGFLALGLDMVMVVGLRLSTGLLYQPVIALALAVPLVGVLMRMVSGGKA